MPPVSAQHDAYFEGIAEYSSGHSARAELLLQEVLAAALRDKDDATTAATLNRLGDIYLNEERFGEAEKAYAKALSVYRRGSASNAAIAATRRNLATTYSLQGRREEAIALLKEASELLKAPDPPELASEILNSLGIVYFRQEKFKKAETLITQALRIALKRGTATPGVGETFNNLGMIYWKQHKYVDAEQAYKRSLDVTEQLFGHVHPDVALTLENLGVLYTEMRRFRDAQDQLIESLAITEHIDPVVEGRVVRTLQRLSAAYLQDGHGDEAEKTLARAVAIVRQQSRPDRDTPVVLEAYSSILKSTGKVAEARGIHAEAQRVRSELAMTVNVQRPN
jgi:tetratricopeptide (TPR) repeat protein